jgi:ADP-heptose:LPS heptosyltransferase
MNAQKNILLIRLKSIGDVLFTLPASNAVRECFPDAHITYLVSAENRLLIETFPGVDEIITMDRARLKKLSTCFPELFRILSLMRKGKYSLVIDLQGYGETGWLAWFSGATDRWGTVYTKGRAWAYTRGITRRYNMHPAAEFLDLLNECGLEFGAPDNRFELPEAAVDAARKIFAEQGLNPEEKTLFIQPFTSRTFKDWPLECYLQVAEYWRDQGLQIAFGGGPGDVSALEPARAAGFSVVAGSPLLVSAALMQLSTLVLGGDTGMLHFANGLGRRCIMLPSSPDATQLYQHADWALSPFGSQENNSLAVETVNDEIAKVLQVDSPIFPI